MEWLSNNWKERSLRIMLNLHRDYIYGMITSHPGITWLVVNKQRIKIGFMWSSLLNNLTISLSLFMLQLPIAVTHRLQYQKLAFIAFLENNVKNCVGDIVYDLDQQKANHKNQQCRGQLVGLWRTEDLGHISTGLLHWTSKWLCWGRGTHKGFLITVKIVWLLLNIRSSITGVLCKIDNNECRRTHGRRLCAVEQDGTRCIGRSSL